MNIKIEVIGPLQLESGISERTGKEFTIRKQPAVLHTGDDYPQRFKLSIGKKPEYPLGIYNVSPDSFRFDNYGGINFLPRLEPDDDSGF